MTDCEKNDFDIMGNITHKRDEKFQDNNHKYHAKEHFTHFSLTLISKDIWQKSDYWTQQ